MRRYIPFFGFMALTFLLTNCAFKLSSLGLHALWVLVFFSAAGTLAAGLVALEYDR